MKAFTDKDLADLRRVMKYLYGGQFSYLVSKKAYPYIGEAYIESNEAPGDTLVMGGYTVTAFEKWRSLRDKTPWTFYRVEVSYQISPPSRDEPAQFDTDVLAEALPSLEAAIGCVVGSEFASALANRLQEERT